MLFYTKMLKLNIKISAVTCRTTRGPKNEEELVFLQRAHITQHLELHFIKEKKRFTVWFLWITSLFS